MTPREDTVDPRDRPKNPKSVHSAWTPDMVVHNAAHGGPSMERTRSLRNQLIFVYGTALGFGLHLGLIHIVIRRSVTGGLFVIVSALVHATLILALWQWVFPRFTSLAASARLASQAAVAVACISVLSVLTIETYSILFDSASILRGYDGGPMQITIPVEQIRRAPLVYALIPIVPTAVLCVVGFNQHWWRISRLQDRQNELRELALSAQLAALQSQINPHFLFNSLNSIAQLISTDPQKAEACVERLGEILRYLLTRAHRDLVPLEEELEIAEAYLEIERARFGENLRIEEDIAEPAREVMLPGLVLQPLVENAVRHGISRKIGGGSVSIRAALENGDLHLSVSDTGVGIDDPEQVFARGVGLRNVRDRMLRLYGEGRAPSIESRSGEGTTVTLRIPLRVAEAAA